MKLSSLFAGIVWGCLSSPWSVWSTASAESPPPATPENRVSFYQEVRPILQARCHGCHQPAKAKGKYVMTDFDRLKAGGESDKPAIVPNKPDESHLIQLITPVDGEAEMPMKGRPLAAQQIALIRRWIEQGAVDDTPANARQRFDTEHPPVYTRAPLITALDYSPDGTWLAVAGFHEIFLCPVDGDSEPARLIGLSERIESVRFSPDGERLVATGGLPARMGEVQIWDVPARRLKLSLPVTYDTVYGASWSPDGRLVAFGCADNTLRVIEARSGKQVVFQRAPEDWVLDTVFSTNGSHVVAVGRDRTAKLIEVETQRFIDNITSITPGALKGGIQAVARHPTRDEILVGGADGVPQIYRMFRQTKRVIGDNANLIRRFPSMPGRIFDVDYAPDGERIVAVSSLDGKGALHLYSARFDSTLTKDLKAIFSKRVMDRSAEEKKRIAAYQTRDVKLLSSVTVDAALYAVRFSPDGRLVACGGSDGVVRIYDASNAMLVRAFVPAPLPDAQRDRVVALSVEPRAIQLTRPFATVQMLVTGWLPAGHALDVTAQPRYTCPQGLVTISPQGVVTARQSGRGQLNISFAGHTLTVPVQVEMPQTQTAYHPDFIQDVNPVLSRLGCNAGTCHGAKEGKNGFKLSLRGYDPVFDVRALVDDLAGRRVNVASPDDSLMLLKATAAVPHEGGQRTTIGSRYYNILRAWIADGARLRLDSPRVKSIRISPARPVIQKLGGSQQVRVVATYTDGQSRDVTAEAFISSGNTEVATASETGRLTAVRRGEAPVLARFEGAYAAVPLTVMGDRTGFAWTNPPVHNQIDALVAAKWKRMKILPSDLCTDAEFLRRVYLDLTGLPPEPETVRAFLADSRETRIKRDEVIDRLIGSEPYVDHWATKWADLLQVNRKFLGAEGAVAWWNWIRDQIRQNTPYDQFARAILTAGGSNRTNPPASYYKVLRTPTAIMENTTQLFLATRFNCNKCHDHPFERWTQDQYYQTAAFFAQVGFKPDPAAKNKRIGGTAVEGSHPLYEIIYDKTEGEVIHERTGQVAPPVFPFPATYKKPQAASRRAKLAAWLTSPDNPYFARSYVNRVWGYLMGRGLIEPLDDIRAGNPPTNPALLDYLTEQFIQSGFDVQALVRLICKSRTYQLSIRTHRWNEDDELNYSHARARRLPAEVLFDTIYAATGATPKVPGVREGTRAAQLPDVALRLPDGFLATFGRPARESACECERSQDVRLGAVMALVTGPTVDRAITAPNNAIVKLVHQLADDRELVQELYLRFLCRPATDREVEKALEVFDAIAPEHQKLMAELAAYRKKLDPIMEKREAERRQQIAAAVAELAAYEKEIAPRQAELDRKQQEAIAKAEQALEAYEAALPDKLAAWEDKPDRATRWQALDVVDAKASNGAKLELEQDGALFVSGKQGRGRYTIRARTGLSRITAVRLEALPDERLPKKGPGRADDGNFVLTELALSITKGESKADKVALHNARATFEQQGYTIKTAIDGKTPTSNNGWAIHPKEGQPQTATFELKKTQPISEGTELVFVLDQNFNSGKHALGRFRLSVTDNPTPVDFGIPVPIEEILAIAPAKRTDQQIEALRTFYRSRDKNYAKLKLALDKAKRPRPIDPKLKALREKVERVKKPLPPDPTLVELERAVELSRRQLEHKRLTAAQDLAWALINTPAFLFNH